MRRTLTVNQKETSAYEKNQQRLLDNLLKELLNVAEDDSFHTLSANQIGTLLKRRLTGPEQRCWNKYSEKCKQELRRKLMLERKAREAGQVNPKTAFDTGLLNVSNYQLFYRLEELVNLHKKSTKSGTGETVNKIGREATHQLIRALAVLTESEIKQVLSQIQKFSKSQKKQAESAIEVITKYYQDLIDKKLREQPLTALNDAELLKYFIYIFNSKETEYNYIVLSYKLQDIQNSAQISDLSFRVSRWKINSQFTVELKQNILVAIEIELIRRLLTPSKRTTKIEYKKITRRVITLITSETIDEAAKAHLHKTLRDIQIDANFYTQSLKDALLEAIPLKPLNHDRGFHDENIVRTSNFLGTNYPPQYIFFNLTDEERAKLTHGFSVVGTYSRGGYMLVWDAENQCVDLVDSELLRRKK